MYCPPGFLDGEDGGGNVINGSWRQELVDGASCALEPLRQAGGNHYSQTASTIRDVLRDYFSSSTGEVSWQYQHVRRLS